MTFAFIPLRAANEPWATNGSPEIASSTQMTWLNSRADINDGLYGRLSSRVLDFNWEILS